MTKARQKNCYLLSLGCPKNEVDAECMSAILRAEGYVITAAASVADYLIVNTCGFIEAAKREAIAAILDLAAVKQEQMELGRRVFLLVTGCLAQRYASEIARDLPEVDAVLGTAEYHLIADCLAELGQKQAFTNRFLKQSGSLEHFSTPHQPSPDRYFAWLKIAEGCNNACAYCAIPAIRGSLRSRSITDLVQEAQSFTELGFKELILISQDTTCYGSDLYRKNCLVELLQALQPLSGLRWLRLLYLYGSSFSAELAALIAKSPQIVPYLDIPIQHASNHILKAMGRKESKESLSLLFRELRAQIPNLVLRTTVMVGFPGETEADFAELLAFIEEMRFERLGCFVFSPEEGTRAANMPAQVPLAVAQARQERLLAVQEEISFQYNLSRVGQVVEVLLEEYNAELDCYEGRSYAEAPDIDPSLTVKGDRNGALLGQFVPVRIVQASPYEIVAEME